MEFSALSFGPLTGQEVLELATSCQCDRPGCGTRSSSEHASGQCPASESGLLSPTKEGTTQSTHTIVEEMITQTNPQKFLCVT